MLCIQVSHRNFDFFFSDFILILLQQNLFLLGCQSPQALQIIIYLGSFWVWAQPTREVAILSYTL